MFLCLLAFVRLLLAFTFRLYIIYLNISFATTHGSDCQSTVVQYSGAVTLRLSDSSIVKLQQYFFVCKD